MSGYKIGEAFFLFQSSAQPVIASLIRTFAS